jgi:hypothetical protein
MKTVIVATMLLVIAAASAQCRIGETLEELNARFGEGKKNSQKIRMKGHDQWYFEKDGIGVQCVMTDDACVMEVFHRVGAEITDRDIKEILKSEGDGHGWGFDQRTKRWTRSDYNLVAYREQGHNDIFYLEKSGKAAKGLPGF